MVRPRCGEAGAACAESGGAEVIETVDRGVQRSVDDHDVGAGDRAGGVGAERGLECFLGVGEGVQGDVGVVDGVKRQAGAGVAGSRREDPEFADLDGGFGVARPGGWRSYRQGGVGAAAVDHTGAGRRVERAGAGGDDGRDRALNAQGVSAGFGQRRALSVGRAGVGGRGARRLRGVGDAVPLDRSRCSVRNTSATGSNTKPVGASENSCGPHAATAPSRSKPADRP